MSFLSLNSLLVYYRFAKLLHKIAVVQYFMCVSGSAD